MRRILPVFCLAASLATFAQTAPKASSAPQHAPARSSATASTATYKLPPDEHRIPGIPRTAFALKYQDIKVGTGREGEAGKLWHVKYKGWRASDGVVFDNWEDHKRPVTDAEGKPEMGPDGKPKLGDPEPLVFPQGVGRLIPGFDYGVTGMRIGGKRRLFIPWQIAYGTRSIPDRADHPGIPAKSDLIFDVELVDVTDMPEPPQGPMVPPGGGSVHPQPAVPPRPGAGAPATPPTGTAPSTTQPAPGQPSTPPQPQQSTPQPQQSTQQPQQSTPQPQ